MGVTFAMRFGRISRHQGGAEAAAREKCPSMKIHGVSVSREAEPVKKSVANMATRFTPCLESTRRVSPEDIIVYDQYYGEKYAVPTEAGNDAIRL